VGLRCRIRLADGRVFAGELAPERHRALQLGLLHEHTPGWSSWLPAVGEMVGCRSPRDGAAITSSQEDVSAGKGGWRRCSNLRSATRCASSTSRPGWSAGPEGRKPKRAPGLPRGRRCPVAT
jgi:hypothetical protein